MVKPLVSVGLPVYQGENYIQEALDSLLAQDYQYFEIIVSDNGSNDKTPEICQRYAEQDSRIRYYSNDKNVGAFANFSRVLDLAVGEFFMWAAHDDLWSANYITSCVQMLEREPSNFILCYTDCIGWNTKTDEKYPYKLTIAGLDDARHRKRATSYLKAKMLSGHMIYGLFKTSVLRSLMPMPNVIGSDLVFLLKILLSGPVIRIPEALRTFRVIERPERQRFEDLYPQLSQHHPFIGYIAQFHWLQPLTILIFMMPRTFAFIDVTIKSRIDILSTSLLVLYVLRFQLRMYKMNVQRLFLNPIHNKT